MADIKVKTTKLNQNAVGEVRFSAATSSDTIVTGTYKGKVTATVSATTNVALVQLP